MPTWQRTATQSKQAAVNCTPHIAQGMCASANVHKHACGCTCRRYSPLYRPSAAVHTWHAAMVGGAVQVDQQRWVKHTSKETSHAQVIVALGSSHSMLECRRESTRRIEKFITVSVLPENNGYDLYDPYFFCSGHTYSEGTHPFTTTSWVYSRCFYCSHEHGRTHSRSTMHSYK